MIEYLWTGKGSAPQEYVDLVLCRDVFHCTPSELDKQDGRRVSLLMEVVSAENYVKQAKANRKKK